MSQLADSMREMDEIERRRNLRTKIFNEVTSERFRQDAQHGRQHWPHFRSDKVNNWRVRRNLAIVATERASKDGSLTWEHILYEEITEAFSEKDWQLRRAELIQCAAVIVAEIEDGDLYPGDNS